MSGFSGCTHGSCSRAAIRISSPTREISRASDGSSAKPSAAASAIAYHMPPNATSTVIVPMPVDVERRVEAVGEARHVRQLDALAAAVAAARGHLDDACRRLEAQRRLRLVHLDHAGLEQHGRDADRVRARHRRVLGRLHDDVARVAIRTRATGRSGWRARRRCRAARAGAGGAASRPRAAPACARRRSRPAAAITPPTTTLPTSPPAWQPTTVIARVERISRASAFRARWPRRRAPAARPPSGARCASAIPRCGPPAPRRACARPPS